MPSPSCAAETDPERINAVPWPNPSAARVHLARANGNELLTALCQAERMPIMVRVSYLLTATRGTDEILQRSFDDRDQANQAIAEALVRYHDSEVRLSQGDAVFISAGPGADNSIIATPR